MTDLEIIRDQLRGDSTEVQLGFQKLLVRWQARAIGLWSFDQEILTLQHFRGVEDMSVQVKTGFQQATKSVSLAQSKFGIVSAVLLKGPAPAYIDPALSPLRDSASWIEKFGCKSSLSVPVFQQERITSVLAVSYLLMIQQGDPAWQEQVQLAAMLGT